MKDPNIVKKIVYCVLRLALPMELPLLTGQIPQIGGALSPMHIPVFICGFLCGWPWGLLTGLIAPLLRFALFGMPPVFPTGVAMAFELAIYGALCGALYNAFPKKNSYIYLTLIISMLAGRVVWGAVRFIIAGLTSTEFPFAAFIAGAFTNGIPGIILHIAIIPPIVIALKKAKLVVNG